MSESHPVPPGPTGPAKSRVPVPHPFRGGTDGTETPGRLAERACQGCETAVTVYPPEDGDGPVTCGRCAGTHLAVVHDRVSADMREAVERRLSIRLADASRRRAQRERARREKTARRDAGLRARHAAKLNRTEKR